MEDLQHYWGGAFLAANAFIGLNLVGALLLGMLVGYERSYNGRAAGMRTDGLVCMAYPHSRRSSVNRRFGTEAAPATSWPIPPASCRA